jgi:Cu+-exporting ATPase
VADVVAGYFVPALVGSAAIKFTVWSVSGADPKMAQLLINVDHGGYRKGGLP